MQAEKTRSAAVCTRNGNRKNPVFHGMHKAAVTITPSAGIIRIRLKGTLQLQISAEAPLYLTSFIITRVKADCKRAIRLPSAER